MTGIRAEVLGKESWPVLIDQLERYRARSLFPFPEGWYVVATRQTIANAKLLQLTWMGEDIVAWCDEDGRTCVAEAYCPHLGSYLGPDTGGRVCEGRLVCPFHVFEFSTSGQCVATPNAPPPRSATLRVFETREIKGLIFAWWGIGGRLPQWDLPPEPEDCAPWSSIQMQTLRFSGHPQETTENGVDMGHLSHVHGYHDTHPIGTMSVDGHQLWSRFDFKRKLKIAGLTVIEVDFATTVLICGLGYSLVQIRERSIGLDARLWVMATPVDGDVIDFTFACQFQEVREPKRRIAGLRFLPVRFRAPIMTKLSVWLKRHDVLQDVTIWSRKRYRARPRLCRSDGEIMKYRAYCEQFYPDEVDHSLHLVNGRSAAVKRGIEPVQSLRV